MYTGIRYYNHVTCPTWWIKRGEHPTKQLVLLLVLQVRLSPDNLEVYGDAIHVPVNDQKHNLEAENIRLIVAESFPLAFGGAVYQQITDSTLAGKNRLDRLPPITSSPTSWTTNISHTRQTTKVDDTPDGMALVGCRP